MHKSTTAKEVGVRNRTNAYSIEYEGVNLPPAHGSKFMNRQSSGMTTKNAPVMQNRPNSGVFSGKLMASLGLTQS